MASLNKVMIIGNLGRDPELRFTGGGDPVCNFSVATTESWRDKSGEKQERTTWHRVTVWGKQAEPCAEHLKKGRPVYVEGRIQQREYEDRDGNKKQTTEIVAERVQFLGSRGDGDGGPSESERYRGKQSADETQTLDDTDIPF